MKRTLKMYHILGYKNCLILKGILWSKFEYISYVVYLLTMLKIRHLWHIFVNIFKQSKQIALENVKNYNIIIITFHLETSSGQSFNISMAASDCCFSAYVSNTQSSIKSNLFQNPVGDFLFISQFSVGRKLHL